MKIPKEKFDKAVVHAKTAFWAELAKRLPEIKTGDMDPIDLFSFDVASRGAASTWVMNNGGKVTK
jgi:hypothetical protein